MTPTQADDSAHSASEALLWLYYYLALHYSHRTNPSPEYAKSLDLINLAIKQDPTNPDPFIGKAHVLKRAGDLEAAAREMVKARVLDKSDRYTNAKTGKYLLRIGEVDKAEQILGLFTKVRVAGVLRRRKDTDVVELCRRMHHLQLMICSICNVCGSCWRRVMLTGGWVTCHSLSSGISRFLRYVLNSSDIFDKILYAVLGDRSLMTTRMTIMISTPMHSGK